MMKKEQKEKIDKPKYILHDSDVKPDTSDISVNSV